jgi:photosystem II stability/assembly factor-like uncharacterized protein
LKEMDCMKKMGSTLARGMIASVLLAAGAAWAVQVADVLRMPAPASARAERAMLPALALAGQRLVAAGEHGIIVYSDNNGARWTQAQVPVSVTLTALHFTDAQHGHAVGHDGAILATSDGGAHWNLQLDGLAINAMMLAEARQIADRAHAALERAVDKKAAQAAVDRADNALADAEAAGKFGPSRPLLAVWFRNASEGWAVGAYGQALHTRDGGAHWLSAASRIPNPEGLHYNAISQGADGTLLIAGEGGKVYRSADAGASWEVSDTGYNGQLYGVVQAAPDALLAYGFGGHVLRSVDGGRNWTALPQTAKHSLIGAASAADGALLLVARDGAVFRSADEGRNFSEAVPGQALNLASARALLAGGATRLALSGMGGVRLLGVGQ